MLQLKKRLAQDNCSGLFIGRDDFMIIQGNYLCAIRSREQSASILEIIGAPLDHILVCHYRVARERDFAGLGFIDYAFDSW